MEQRKLVKTPGSLSLQSISRLFILKAINLRKNHKIECFRLWVKERIAF